MRPDYGMGSVSAAAEIAARGPKSGDPACLKHPRAILCKHSEKSALKIDERLALHAPIEFGIPEPSQRPRREILIFLLTGFGRQLIFPLG
jgi:hypothetical protein